MSEMNPHDDEWRELLANWKDQPRDEALDRLGDFWDDVARRESYVVKPAAPVQPGKRKMMGWLVAVGLCILLGLLAWRLGSVHDAPRPNHDKIDGDPERAEFRHPVVLTDNLSWNVNQQETPAGQHQNDENAGRLATLHDNSSIRVGKKYLNRIVQCWEVVSSNYA